MRFVWDPAKERWNKAKHGLDFSFAEAVFSDPLRVLVFDRHDAGEERWHCVGVVAGGIKTLVVVHTYPDEDDPELVRIIGIRRSRGTNEGDTKMASDRKLTGDQMAQLRVLDGREPDTSDIPEAPAANWRHAERGALFRPRKQAISLRVDMDVLAWLRSYGPGYQSRINEILRRQMDSEQAG